MLKRKSSDALVKLTHDESSLETLRIIATNWIAKKYKELS